MLYRDYLGIIFLDSRRCASKSKEARELSYTHLMVSSRIMFLYNNPESRLTVGSGARF